MKKEIITMFGIYFDFLKIIFKIQEYCKNIKMIFCQIFFDDFYMKILKPLQNTLRKSINILSNQISFYKKYTLSSKHIKQMR